MASRERPILFSAPMVRAILAGRKTQTRRLFEIPFESPFEGTQVLDGQVHALFENGDIRGQYGVPGDRLWVRETWRAEERASDSVAGIRFAADDAFVAIADTREAAERWMAARHMKTRPADVPADARVWAARPYPADQWRPNIFLPRWASRITLEVTGVRAERLQAIADADIRAEGVDVPVSPPDAQGRSELLVRLSGKHPPTDYLRPYRGQPYTEAEIRRAEFASLWDSLNGARASWASNPWVWCIEFKRVEQAK